MCQAARRNRTSPGAEAVAAGLIDEASLYRNKAEWLGLPFLEPTPDAEIGDVPHLDRQLMQPRVLRLRQGHRSLTLLVPLPGEETEIRERLSRLPGARQGLALTTPSALRAAVWQAGARRRVHAAVNQLFETRPAASARVTLWGRQGFALGLLVSLAGLLALRHPSLSLFLLHAALSLLYLAALVFRLSAGLARCPVAIVPAGQTEANDEPLPTYTVLVALYREAGVARTLVGALAALDWPKSLLDIKLVCESDDAETVAALRAAIAALPPGAGASAFEIVLVPDMPPRTKPKALSYALAGARGTYVTVFDAEDRPHPGQLREAHARFRPADEGLACLQAPLAISNAGAGWLPAMFALEYAIIFRGILPFLARHRLPMPLGGTSNHFRRAALAGVGGWDPFNVTEDADLGLRLARAGYRCATLGLPTWEEAPTHRSVWLAQRSRWFKGWMQTWLVAMRRPLALRRDIGWKGFLVFHLMVGGMLLSALTHPMLYLLVALRIVSLLTAAVPLTPLALALDGLDLANILFSFIGLPWLGLRRMGEGERKAVGRRYLAVPLYWLLLSRAAWRASSELIRSPFTWNKTPHGPGA